MFRNILTAGSAGLALIVASPLLAQAHGGGPAGAAGSNASVHSQGPANASPTGIAHASPNSVLSNGQTTTMTLGTSFSPRSQASMHSQALQHASPNAIAHASRNSVLARGSVSSTALSGLTTGLQVQTSTGTVLGTVSRVITGPNNTVRAVIVTSASGQTHTLAGTSLSISGNVVTTTSLYAGSTRKRTFNCGAPA